MLTGMNHRYKISGLQSKVIFDHDILVKGNHACLVRNETDAWK